MNFVVKLYPKTIWGPAYDGNLDRLVDELAETGVGAVACPVFEGRRLFFETKDTTDLPHSMLPLAQRLQQAGIGFWPVFPVFHDPDTFESHPQFRPIGLNAKAFPTEGWYRPICPTHPEYRGFRLALIEEALTVFRPTVFSLDFVRYPLQWESVDLDEMGLRLPPYCYCARCLATFQETTGLRSPGDDVHRWFEWRARTISGFVDEVRDAANTRLDSARIALNVIPAVADHYFERVYRAVGQDLAGLGGVVDFFSPMLYHLLLRRPMSWVVEVSRLLRDKLADKVLPSLQVVSEKEGGGIDITEFESLFAALGNLELEVVSLFHWEGLLETPALRELVQEFAAE